MKLKAETARVAKARGTPQEGLDIDGEGVGGSDPPAAAHG